MLVLLMTAATTLFVRPDLLINPRTLAWALNRTKVLKRWSWDEAVIGHEWVKWNKRHLNGHFKNFCFEVDQSKANVRTCLSSVSWNFVFVFGMKGMGGKTIDPVEITSPWSSITLKEGAPPSASSGPPPDLWKYWNMLWSDIVPGMRMDFKKITIKNGKFNKTFDFNLVKSERELHARGWVLELAANPKELVLSLPRPWALPENLGLGHRAYIRNVKLFAQMNKKGIPLHLSGGLEALQIDVKSRLDLPLKKQFIKPLFLNSTAELNFPDVRGNLKKYGPRSLNALPAPFSAMNGTISAIAHVEDAGANEVFIKGLSSIDLKGGKQFFQMEIGAKVLLDVEKLRPGSIAIDLDFKKIALVLPRYDKKSLPPQFFPDKRFKLSSTKGTKRKRPQAQEERPLMIHLTADGANALHILTDLLDEPLRLNLDLLVGAGNIQKGHLDVLPLKTRVFKRPVHVQNLRLTFNHPLVPVLEARILFPLPEYKITMKLKGPVFSPSYAFSSDPPLPQDDIYGVLLFGRPLSELDPEASSQTRSTRELLSQGVLSLSVLYFLSGSRVQYIGVNKESKAATAQIGLGSKSSLNVEAGKEGVRGTSVRRSLGRGWYIDTSVQNPQSIDARAEKAYGVLLERIIAY